MKLQVAELCCEHDYRLKMNLHGEEQQERGNLFVKNLKSGLVDEELAIVMVIKVAVLTSENGKRTVIG